MDIKRIYIDQLENNQSINKHSIFKEYCNLCRFLHKCNLEDSELIEIIEAYITKNNLRLYKDDPKILETANKVIDSLNRMNEVIIDNFPSVNVDAVILLGDGYIDGHGIIADNKPYVLIDLRTMIKTINEYDMEVFILHEMIHAVHYHLSNNMYFQNYNGIKDQYYKRIVSEGIATFVSGKLLNGTPGRTTGNEFWLGHFNADETEIWIKQCQKRHLEIADRLQNSIINDQVDEDLYYDLFSVTDPNNLHNCRIGYYYGSKICEQAYENRNLETLLRLGAEDWEALTSTYFKI